jgi:hypothetical protein
MPHMENDRIVETTTEARAIMSRTTAMLGVALAGALAATGVLAQSKPVDKTSQKFIFISHPG